MHENAYWDLQTDLGPHKIWLLTRALAASFTRRSVTGHRWVTPTTSIFVTSRELNRNAAEVDIHLADKRYNDQRIWVEARENGIRPFIKHRAENDIR